ncbi:hypothetical protein TALC_00354 [Thermoplasmatales archaeon BRNA1]|nr:hypothetical protein TALC_00354 [Thermoplasmatales archaeon BRNA1]
MQNDMRQGEPIMFEDGTLGFEFYGPNGFRPVEFGNLLQDIEGENEKQFRKAVTEYILNNRNRWPFPGPSRPFTVLDELEGDEPDPFDLEVGDYRRRFRNLGCRIMRYVTEHFYLVGEYDAEAIMAFVVATYFKEVFDHMPRLIIRGASNSGKSKLLEFLGNVCYRGFLDADITGPSLFRLIENTGITPLLDEVQDYNRDQRRDIKMIFKNGQKKNGHVTRSIKTDEDYKIVTYSVYAPMAIVNQSGGIIDDTENNRSVTIRMINSGRRRIPMRPDFDELRCIRTELYTLRAIWRTYPRYLDMDRAFRETIGKLEAEEGIWSDVTGTAVTVSTRARDMAGTLLTIAGWTGTFGPILEILRDQETATRSSETDSEDGMTFRALLHCIMQIDHQNDIKMHRKIYVGAESVSTRQIAEEYNTILIEDGESSSIYQKVPTRAVTNRLIDLGFKIDDRKMAGNLSRLSRIGFEDIFASNLERFGTEEEKEFFHNILEHDRC